MNIKKSKTVIGALIAVIVTSCNSTLSVLSNKPLFEIVTQQKDGGASIRFFEILSEFNEIKMLLNDSNLRKKINEEDIQNSNFIILNIGEKKSDGYSITIKNIRETPDKIIIETEEIIPKNTIQLEEFVYPYTIVKINSKKKIEFN